MIFVEKSALSLPLTEFLNKEGREMKVIGDISEVPDEKSNIIITSDKDNFVHPCPGTNIYRCCNYHVADIMQGCPFDCSYCILQLYLSHRNIHVSARTDILKNAVLEAAEKERRRIGTGELSDSLALDSIIPLTKILMPIKEINGNIQYEFKTKSDNIGNLLNMNPKNTVISWSVNPQAIIDKEEPFTSSLARRLKAAEICSQYGYRVGFHFDPLIMREDFENIYGNLCYELTERIREKDAEFISISSFRCPPELLTKIRAREDPSLILKGDFIKGCDGKARYFKPLRTKMIKFIYNSIRKKWKNVFIYFCMEHESLWENLIGYDPGSRADFEKYFPFYLPSPLIN